jgi:hypothetical protein
MTFSVNMLDLTRHLAGQQVAQRLDKDFAFSMDLQILKLVVTLHRPLLVIHYPPNQ